MSAHTEGGEGEVRPRVPLRVLIADDEAPARSRVKVLLADLAATHPTAVVGEAEHGAQALALLREVEVDVALVDIRMPRMDGVEFTRQVARMAHPPAVIFLSAYDQYAVQAFEVNAVDYLLKPVRASRLALALEKVTRRGPAESVPLLPSEGGAARRRHLSCSERGRVLLVPVADILYLRAEQKYVTARTLQREFLLDESLVQLEQEFPERFLRVHRNCLVARQAVTGFERVTGEQGEAHWAILIEGLDERVAVSRRQWPTVRALQESLPGMAEPA